MFGVITECWKCNKAFSFYFTNKLPIFPLCEECDKSLEAKRNRIKSIVTKVHNQEYKEERENKDIDILDSMLTELGWK